ncbi:Protein N-acetyltransferase, RimJ/RimL family [Brevibacterium siliguriense]|uniref:Protein N-acetyltransferase, RimJ/RimL family n=1 Tax=Brevibacterium siliguriense TaxID=1136497 RepID=A0A1H1Q3B5_9MICO|nr:GNAT family N-acetyltransferase [Brevibacterium siliguriense]SDS18011.1 Protein N-acetyltransferase, RimJ/RimL family [Brevibacterium siliguriense]
MGRTPDYVLDRPQDGDVEQLFSIDSDPRVWRHLPSGRMTVKQEAEALLDKLQSQWELDGIGPWMVREVYGGDVLGHCGCSLRGVAGTGASRREPGAFWNLGYRFRPEAQGRGLATAVSQEAIAAAGSIDPTVPVVAYLLEHNVASAVVARRLGLELVHRAPDVGNPDSAAVRLVFADRELTSAQLDAALA